MKYAHSVSFRLKLARSVAALRTRKNTNTIDIAAQYKYIDSSVCRHLIVEK